MVLRQQVPGPGQAAQVSGLGLGPEQGLEPEQGPGQALVEARVSGLGLGPEQG